MRKSIVGPVFLLLLMPWMVEATSLDERAKAIDSPTIGAALDLGGALTFGHSTITPSASSQVRELLCGEQRCGVYISGSAQFSHTVDDPFSLPVARRNFDTALGEKVKESGPLILDRTLEEAIIWTWSVQDLTASSEAPASPLPEWVSETLSEPFFGKPSQDLLRTQHLSKSDIYYGLLVSGSDQFILSYDPWDARNESVYLLDKVKSAGSIFKGSHYLYEICTQPVNRQWWENTYAEMVTIDTIVSVDNDKDAHLTIRSELLVEATKKTQIWRADLRSFLVEDNAKIPHNVVKVEIDGKPAPYLHAQGSLLVDLGREFVPGNQARIIVETEGDLATQFGGDRFWSLGTWAWYPQPPLNGELSTFSFKIRTPEKMVPFASGTTVERKVVEGYNILETKLDKPHQFPVISAGNYTVYEDTKADQTCRVATYAFGKEKPAKRLIKNCFAALSYYELLFGIPFPYAELTFVERNDWGWAQAPPGIVFITKEAFDTVGTATNQFFSQSINSRIVHELAHTYWGHVAKMVTADEQWITESFADYSAALCLEAMKGGGKKGRREFEKEIKDWKSRVAGMKPGSVYLANRLAGKEEMDQELRTKLLYGKGPLILHHLRLELQKKYGSEDKGDEVFYTWLRSILQNFSFRFAETKHMVGILNQLTQHDWQPFFEQYIYGTDMPDLKKL